MSATTPEDRHGCPAQYRQAWVTRVLWRAGTPAELESAEELLTRRQVPSDRREAAVARCEHCGGDELLDVGGAQHPVDFAMMGATAPGSAS
jgi:hypothetical protein